MARTNYYSEEYLLDKIKEASAILGHPVSKLEMVKLKGFPSKNTFERRFGTWNNAKKRVGEPIHEANKGYPPGSEIIKRIVRKGIATKIKNGSILKTRYESRQPPRSLRFKIFIRDNFICQYCGQTVKDGAKLVIDHIIPFSKGGPTSMKNLTTSCFECNLGKSDILLKEL